MENQTSIGIIEPKDLVLSKAVLGMYYKYSSLLLHPSPAKQNDFVFLRQMANLSNFGENASLNSI